jgi:hypothetical protein
MIFIVQSWPLHVMAFFLAAIFFLSFWGAVRFGLVGGTVCYLIWVVAILAELAVTSEVMHLPDAIGGWLIIPCLVIGIVAGARAGRKIWRQTRRRAVHVDK